MKKSEEFYEAIRQEARQRRYPVYPEHKRKERFKPVQLSLELQRDYETLMCETAWKILFIERKLKTVQEKFLANGVTSVNKKRLENQLADAESLLNVIKERMQYVKSIEKWEWELVQTYDQRAGISNVYDLYR